ncbi:MAG: serine hydrolase domain-containing protein [Bacteroidota bacterium]
MRRFLLFIWLVLHVITGCAQDIKRIARIEKGLRSQWKTRPSQRMNLVDRMAFYKVPGLSMAMIDKNKIVWTRTYGLIESGRPDMVTSSTLFQSGSIGKAVIATAALQLVEQGSLLLDVPANQYLKSWRIPDNSFTRRTPVTLRQLLSHTAGVNLPGVIGYQVDEALPDLIQILNGSPPANTPPIVVDRVPQTKFSYSGGGYMIVQQLIMDGYEQAATFPEIMDKQVFKPAGMLSTSFDYSPDISGYEVASGHRATGNPLAGKWYRYPEMGMGVFWTTPTDMARFLIQIMEAYQGCNNQLLSEELVRAMLYSYSEDQGLGFKLGDDGKDRFYIYHRGAVEGFQTFMVAYPMKKQGVVIMTNSDQGWPLIQEIIKSISIEYKWVAGFYLP